MSNIEKLLTALINEENVEDFVPHSRVEEILKACCCGEECGVVPRSRIEALLKVLHTKIAEGGGGGGGTGGGGGSANIEPLTITKNGTYNAGEFGGFEIGKECTFRSNFTDAELRSLYAKGQGDVGYRELCNPDDGYIGLYTIDNTDSGVPILYWEEYEYMSDEAISSALSQGWEVPSESATWVRYDDNGNPSLCAAPTVLIPYDIEFLVSLDDVANLFKPKRTVDGFAPITVQIPSIFAGYFNQTLKYANLSYAYNLPESVFEGFYQLAEVDLMGVTSLPRRAFANCFSLSVVSNWDRLDFLGQGAFQSCKQLVIEKLPPNLVTIESGAFAGVGAIYDGEIPASVKSVGYCCFGWGSSPDPKMYPRPNTITFKGKPDYIDPGAFTDLLEARESEFRTLNVPWAEGEVAGAPWCSSSVAHLLTINYNYKGE